MSNCEFISRVKKSFAISGVIRLDYNYPPAPGTLGAMEGGEVHRFLISGDYPYGTGVGFPKLIGDSHGPWFRLGGHYVIDFLK